jgi:hypothetical protein
MGSIVGLAVLAAACAALTALAFLGVRSIPVTVYRFSAIAGVVWAVLLLVIAGAWLLARRIRRMR